MLQMVRKTIITVVALISLISCNTQDIKGLFMPTGAGVEKRFEQSQEMTSGNSVATITAAKEYSFYVCTDPHVDKTSKNLEQFNDDLRNDINASFGIVLGDCTDTRDNLPSYLNAIAYNEEKHLFDYKIFNLLGNHDVYFNGWEDFKELIGPSVYWFEVDFASGKDIYISLDSATGTLGGQQTSWLKNFLTQRRSSYRHCIIMTHTNLFYTKNTATPSANMPIEETFALVDLFTKHNVQVVLQGHNHKREDITHNSVRYTVLGSIEDKAENPEYLKINITPSGLAYQWVILD